MGLTYTTQQKFPLLDSGGNNWGAIINAALMAMDAGREITIEAGENISQYEVVYISTDGKMYKAKADSASTMPAVGICPYAVTSGNDGKVRVVGWIQNGSWSFTAGDKIYVSSGTAGALTANKPAINPMFFGIALTSDTIIIDPQREAERGDILCNNEQVMVNNEKVLYNSTLEV